jgi:hypothetical protein
MPSSLLQLIKLTGMTELHVVHVFGSRVVPDTLIIFKSALSTLPFLADWHGVRAVNHTIEDPYFWTDEETALRAAAGKRPFEDCAAQVNHRCSVPCADSSVYAIMCTQVSASMHVQHVTAGSS